MPLMLMTAQDYAEVMFRGKGFQRKHVVEVLFTSQTRLARELGVTQSLVSHVCFMRKRSRRVEEYIHDRVRTLRPELLGLWEIPWAKNGEKKAA